MLGFCALTQATARGGCGTCSHTPARLKAGKAPADGTGNIETDGVLRTYRLAIPVDYGMYQELFYQNEGQVWQFWDEVEQDLNKIYTPELGVRFQVVKDRKLIVMYPNNSPFKGMALQNIVYAATQPINDMIGEDAYDAGIWIAGKTYDLTGMAELGGVYKREYKGAAVATVNRTAIVGHELGHLFGAHHSHTNGVSAYESVEPYQGRSMMGYGGDMDFFNLYSVKEITTKLNATPYYTDNSRKTLSGQSSTVTNYPVGTPRSGNGPAIDRSSIGEALKVPAGSYFYIAVPETESAHTPAYKVHQMDLGTAGRKAKFLAHKGTADPMVPFQTEFNNQGLMVLNSDPRTVATGEYTFWLGAYDGSAADSRAPFYDVVQRKLEIVQGTPFTITAPDFSQHATFGKGELVELRWDVDQTLYPQGGSFVRILMSDDLGRTFPHVIVDRTPNDGSCTIAIPQKTVAMMPEQTDFMDKAHYPKEVRPGVIKVEIIGGGAFALSPHYPAVNAAGLPTSELKDLATLSYGGGFTVSDGATKVKFTGTPEAAVTLGEGESMPAVAQVAATSANGAPLQTTYHEETEDIGGGTEVVVRTWKATAEDGSQYAFQQRIRRPKTETGEGGTPATVEFAAGGPLMATMYYGGRNLVVPQGVTAHTYRIDGGSIVESRAYRPGDVLPKGEAVVVKAQTVGEYVFEATDTEAAPDPYNSLRGTDNAETLSAPGTKYYVLSLDSGHTPGSYGFYYQNAGGGSVDNGAHRAYLPVDEGSAMAKGYPFGVSTGIAATHCGKPEQVYDLQGLRVERPSRGLYIVGGKKRAVK